MILDNDRFTEEQKQIISKIGQKYKSNKKKYIQKLNVSSFIVVLFFIGILVGLYILDSRMIFTLIFIQLQITNIKFICFYIPLYLSIYITLLNIYILTN